MESVLFVNWTDEDFTGMWGKEDYRIARGQKIYFPRYLADHFAKHLVDREMNKAKLATDHHTRPEFMAKCFSDIISSEGNSSLKTDVENFNRNTELKKELTSDIKPVKKEPFCTQCDSRGGRHKNECPTLGFTAAENPTTL